MINPAKTNISAPITRTSTSWFYIFTFNLNFKPEKPLYNSSIHLAMEPRGTRCSSRGHDLRGHSFSFGLQPPAVAASSIITAVQQQDYSASVWLRRREKLEHVSSEYLNWYLRKISSFDENKEQEDGEFYLFLNAQKGNTVWQNCVEMGQQYL